MSATGREGMLCQSPVAVTTGLAPVSAQADTATSARGPPQMPFILATGTGKADSDTRKLIRRHVMVGKNRGKRRPRNLEQGSPRSATGVKLGKKPDILPAPSGTHRYIPRRVGSELSLIQFADTIDPSAVSTVLEFSSIAKQAMFPLEPCLLFERKQSIWVQALAVDAAYLHATVLATQVYFDLVLKQGGTPNPSLQTSVHFSKSVRLLSERLSMGMDHAISDLTVSVVLSLALYSYMIGDSDGSACHMAGLRRIVDLKGGLGAFDDNPKLRIELLRCDVSLALYGKAKPFFAGDPFLEAASLCPPSWTLPFDKGVKPNGTPTSVRSSESLGFLNNIHPELARIWDLATEFSCQINLASKNGLRLPPQLMFNTMTSVMYRLLDMAFAVGSLNETVRLGLLAFSSSVFLQWRKVRAPYPHFPAMYRDSLTASSSLDAPPGLWLWLLTMGAISVFDESDNSWFRPWFRSFVAACGVRELTWDELRDILESFLWIGLVHDEPGGHVVATMSRKDKDFA